MIKVGDWVDALPSAKKRYFEGSEQKFPFIVKSIMQCGNCDLEWDSCPGKINNDECFGYNDEGFILFTISRDWDNEENI